MSLHIKAVTDVLNRRQVDILPRGELFIHRGFLDHFFGSNKGEYVKQLKRAAQCLGLSLIGVELDTDEAQSPLLDRGCKQLEEYFIVACIDGPIAKGTKYHGFFNTMINMRKKPLFLTEMAKRLLEDINQKAKKIHAKGFKAIAIADDIAGNQGLLFSFDFFMESVYPLYREIADIIRENGLFAFFHSDGDVRRIIRPLIDSGYDCLHPVDTQAGLDLYGLKEEFREKLCFMGHIDTITWTEERIHQEIGRAENEFKEGGLILGSTSGISLETVNDQLGALYPLWERWSGKRRGMKEVTL